MPAISIETLGLDKALDKLATLPKQVRFGASMGMNRTMNEAQDAIRAKLSTEFTLRRSSFILSTIYRKPGVDFATKDNLVAGVRINPDRNILGKFEAGGEKAPTNGRSFLAIPIDVKTNKRDIVTSANSVKALLSSGKAYVRDGKVWQLIGRGKIRKRILAYVFKKATPLPASLNFVRTGTAVINSRAKANIEGAIIQNLTTGLTTSNGSQSGS